MCSIFICCGPSWGAEAGNQYDKLDEKALVQSLVKTILHLRSVGHGNRKTGREKWNGLTLAFPDTVVEGAFITYLSSLRQNATRSSLLMLSFQYILFQIFSWQTTDYVDLALRGGYVIFLLTLFSCSFTELYKQNVQKCSLAVALITFFEAIAEAALLGNLISPYTILILVVLMAMWTVFVRFRFIYAVTLCTSTIVAYNAVCFILLGTGHIHVYVPGKGGLGTLMLYYDCILIITAVTIGKMSHRFEVQTRYNFLSYCANAQESNPGMVSPNIGGPRQSSERDRVSVLETAEGLLGVGNNFAPASVGTSPSRSLGFTARSSVSSYGKETRLPLLGEEDSSSVYSTFARNGAGGSETVKQEYEEDLTSSSLRASMTSGDDHNEGTVSAIMSALDRIKEAHQVRGFSGGSGLISRRLDDIVRDSGATSNIDYLRDAASLSKESKVCSNIDCPQWYSPYPYIYSGYRIFYSAPMCWKSIFQWHNETMNIWTEIFPLVFFTAYSIDFMTNNEAVQAAPFADKLIIGIGLFGCVILRPIISGAAHTFSCESSYKYVLWWGMDYFSICVAIVSSSLIYSRFTWYCEPQQYIFYVISTVGLLISTLVSVLYVASGGVRLGSFILLICLANVLPLVWQITLQYTADEGEKVPPEFLFFWISGGGLMVLGLLIKSSMIPEICCPGKFDLCASSHNWWHLCINGGFVALYPAIEIYLKFRKGNMCVVP